jgi:hypothetical protein
MLKIVIDFLKEQTNPFGPVPPTLNIDTMGKQFFSGLPDFVETREAGEVESNTHVLRSAQIITILRQVADDKVPDYAFARFTLSNSPSFFYKERSIHVNILRMTRNMLEDIGLKVRLGIEINDNSCGIPVPWFEPAKDLAAMMMTPLEGYSKRHFVLADPGEPFFVLLGRDPQAPELVNQWADIRNCCNSDDQAKVIEARDIAMAMEEFKEDNPERGMSMEIYEDGRRSWNNQNNDE